MEQSCLIHRMAILMVTLLQTVKRVLCPPPLTVLVENVVVPMFLVLTIIHVLWKMWTQGIQSFRIQLQENLQNWQIEWVEISVTNFEAMLSHMYEPLLITVYGQVGVEACVAQQVTPRTLDLEVRCSSLARCVVSLDKELYSTLSLFTQVYKWVPATYCWGVTLWWTSILSRG